MVEIGKVRERQGRKERMRDGEGGGKKQRGGEASIDAEREIRSSNAGTKNA